MSDTPDYKKIAEDRTKIIIELHERLLLYSRYDRSLLFFIYSSLCHTRDFLILYIKRILTRT